MDFDVPSISAIVAAAGVLIGVVYYILDMEHQTQLRQTDLIMRLYSTRTSKEFQESWKRAMSTEPKDYRNYEKWHEWSDFIVVAGFFEGIGILLHRKLVDIALVGDLFSCSIKTIWEKTKEVVEGVRKYHNAPQI
jgi:hypothetical protein